MHVTLEGCFEAVFALEFDLPPEFYQEQRANYPVLLLLDFKLTIDGLNDEYLVYERDLSQQVGLSKIQKRLREQKSRDIGLVRQLQLDTCLRELQENPFFTHFHF